MAHYTLTIDTTKNHAGIVIGKNGSYIQKINKRYNVKVQIHNPTLESLKNYPYFTVTGPKENIQSAAIHIYNILHKSMFETEAKLRSTIFLNNSKHQSNIIHIQELKEQITGLKAEIDELMQDIQSRCKHSLNNRLGPEAENIRLNKIQYGLTL